MLGGCVPHSRRWWEVSHLCKCAYGICPQFTRGVYLGCNDGIFSLTDVIICPPYTHVIICPPYTDVMICLSYTDGMICPPYADVIICPPYTDVICHPYTDVICPPGVKDLLPENSCEKRVQCLCGRYVVVVITG